MKNKANHLKMKQAVRSLFALSMMNTVYSEEAFDDKIHLIDAHVALEVAGHKVNLIEDGEGFHVEVDDYSFDHADGNSLGTSVGEAIGGPIGTYVGGAVGDYISKQRSRDA